MNNNIFKGAKFGDKFLTRGCYIYDIVSKYKEHIDENKLDELAENNSSWCDIADTEGISGMDIRNAYKAGYRDAFKNRTISH